MADEANDVPTAPVVEEPVQEEVETSTDDAQEDINLEDIEITDDELDDDTDESTPEEEQASDSEEQSEEDVEELPQDSEESPQESEEKPTNSEEDRKRHNAEMAQRRIAEREARQQELQTRQQQYLQDAEDDKDLALRQLQVDAYNNRVDFNKSKLETGVDKAIASIDLFTKGTDEQKEYLAQSLDDFERMFVTYDEMGNPIDVRGNVEQFLQERAETARRLAGVGARTQTKAKATQSSKTLTPPSRAPKEPKVDSDLTDFDKGWD